jgi:hypothetical protein
MCATASTFMASWMRGSVSFPDGSLPKDQQLIHPCAPPQRIARASARVFIGEEAYRLVASNLLKKVSLRLPSQA